MMQCNSLIVPTLKIEIMKTIKQIVFCVSLLLVMNCFYSCSNSNDVVINTQQNQEKTQDVEIQELIDFIETLNANKIQTRGPFWNRIKRFCPLPFTAVCLPRFALYPCRSSFCRKTSKSFGFSARMVSMIPHRRSRLLSFGG